MGKFIFEEDIDKILDALDKNILFSAVFDYEENSREKWREILYNEPFINIWEEILNSGCMESGLFSTNDDIVFCMCPEVNKSKINLNEIYNTVNYKQHGNEQPVFFVDNTIFTTRNNGVLFTTKGVYRKNKEMIAFSPFMHMKADMQLKEIYIKQTRILSYNGTRDIFEDIIYLSELVYFFNCIRHEEDEKPFIGRTTKGIWQKDENGNMDFNSQKFREYLNKRDYEDSDGLNEKGTGDNTSSNGCLGTIILIIIVAFLFKSCA